MSDDAIAAVTSVAPGVPGKEALLAELLLGWPPLVDTEWTNRCNLHCRICPRQALRRPSGEMDEATLRQIVAAAPSGSRLVACGFGEPTLHPDFGRMLARFTERGDVTTSLTTNGTRLDGAVLAALITTPPDVITVSVNGAGAESYEKIMRGACFALLQERVRRLLEGLGGRSRVEIAVTRTRTNAGEIPSIKAYWEGEGASVQVSDCHSRGGFLYDPELYRFVPPVAEHCWIFPRIYFFSWNGDLLACCHDLAGVTRLGHISAGWPSLVECKRSILRSGCLFDLCRSCDDPLRGALGG